MGNVTFLECSKEKNYFLKNVKVVLIYDFFVRKDYLKSLGYGLLYLPSLMTPRCSKT
jgi:hypothetical protein